MIDATRLQPLQSSLEVDGYRLEAWEAAGRIGVWISASADACADCLVPKDMMRGILGQVLRVAEDTIDLCYPGELGYPGESAGPREPS